MFQLVLLAIINQNIYCFRKYSTG